MLKRLTTNSDGKTPVVKNLDAAWIKKLADRGEPTLYTKANSSDFAYIGMPVGGIGAGDDLATLYAEPFRIHRPFRQPGQGSGDPESAGLFAGQPDHAVHYRVHPD